MVKLEDLEVYEFSQRICAEHGKGVNIWIDAKVTLNYGIVYEVFEDKELVYEVECLNKAINYYNGLQNK